MASEREDAIILVEYDPRWPIRYEEERSQLLLALDGLSPRIEHIGSTAVPGLCAKPIIDILVGLDRFDNTDDYRRRLGPLGYLFVEQEGGRLFFRKGMPRSHHLHLVIFEGDEWQRHLRFRDRLRSDATLREDYAQLKRRLAETHQHDRVAYGNAKSALIRAGERGGKGER